ncbi:MAG: oxygen-independent coproporphyrinogen III oxidase [Gammaproteobacteria bacterium]|nr:oxygen-independent coproporphyrinogen III oxidase [Gammaproteobacteria bacterium]
MSRPPLFQEHLINRYDKPGPRYTSYPPATEFNDKITESDFRDWARASNEELIPKSLSLYFHIPFCSPICDYCACNKVITRRKQKVESYLRDLHREIEIQSQLFDRDREVRQLHWGGGTPGFLTHRQSQDLMDKIAQHFNLIREGEGEKSIEINLRILEKGGVAHLRDLGFNRISIGVHGFDEKKQKSVNLIQSLETTAAVINDARRFGIRSINIDLIYGLPGQAVESFTRTLETIVDLAPDRIAIYNYASLPYRFAPQRQSQAENLPELSERLAMMNNAIENLCAAGYEHIGMGHFARPGDELSVAQRDGSLHRNFKGYSAQVQCDSIGFGVSAISQVLDNFSQNTTSLDDYHDSLEQQRLPVIRGYESHEDDLLRREIIQGVSCDFQLDKRKIGRQWNIDFDDYFADELKRLEDMEKDGLIEMANDKIVVRAPGRLLVRNICMVFDAYQRSGRAAGLNSRTV